MGQKAVHRWLRNGKSSCVSQAVLEERLGGGMDGKNYKATKKKCCLHWVGAKLGKENNYMEYLND